MDLLPVQEPAPAWWGPQWLRLNLFVGLVGALSALVCLALPAAPDPTLQELALARLSPAARLLSPFVFLILKLAFVNGVYFCLRNVPPGDRVRVYRTLAGLASVYMLLPVVQLAWRHLVAAL